MSIGLEKKSFKKYGNYRGKVINNDDPQKLGRIQVEIYPMFVYSTEAEKAVLPWAVPAFGLSVGSGKDGDTSYGTFSVPDIGTMVWVFFEAGDVYQPVYFAEASDGVKGLPEDKDTNYPNTRAIKTKNGIKFKFDDTQGQEDIRVDHPSGSWVEFFPDGRVTLHTTTIQGTQTIEADKARIVLNAKDNSTLVQASRDVTIVSTGDSIYISSNAGNVELYAASQVKITAPKTRLSGNIFIDTGANGVFTTADSQVVTVSQGIITEIV